MSLAAFEKAVNLLLPKAKMKQEVPAYFAMEVAVRYTHSWTKVPERRDLAQAWFADAFSVDTLGIRLLSEEYQSHHAVYDDSDRPHVSASERSGDVNVGKTQSTSCDNPIERRPADKGSDVLDSAEQSSELHQWHTSDSTDEAVEGSSDWKQLVLSLLDKYYEDIGHELFMRVMKYLVDDSKEQVHSGLRNLALVILAADKADRPSTIAFIRAGLRMVLEGLP